jgi:hypothetical protein
MKRWWVPGCVIGYEHTFINALADFITGLEKGEPARPVPDALETQRVCDAVLNPRAPRMGLAQSKDSCFCSCRGLVVFITRFSLTRNPE